MNDNIFMRVLLFQPVSLQVSNYPRDLEELCAFSNSHDSRWLLSEDPSTMVFGHAIHGIIDIASG